MNHGTSGQQIPLDLPEGKLRRERLSPGVDVKRAPYLRNALIDAAPDLLAALETLTSSLEWEEKRSGTTYNGYDDARAAIAKAKRR